MKGKVIKAILTIAIVVCFSTTAFQVTGKEKVHSAKEQKIILYMIDSGLGDR
ncbi:hypothetical protein AAIE21_26285 [Paenibacillus sp. 102]|uniref:hypothetical protein n=1 Tax=Paenibacillus sp. 102 TaxID=3120823 RepID=UPI0031BA7984